MKIELTKSQLLHILTQHFNVTVEEVTITGSDKAELIEREISQFRYQSDQKILAIKALRELAHAKNWIVGGLMGLGDAKWAVENFHQFIEFVRANDRLPLEGYNELK